MSQPPSSPLLVHGQRLSNSRPASSGPVPPPYTAGVPSPIPHRASPPLSFHTGSPSSPMMHPPSPSRFGVLSVASLPSGALMGPAAVTSPSPGVSRGGGHIIPIRPQARMVGPGFAWQSSSTLHPVHSTAVQALHSVGHAAATQKAAQAASSVLTSPKAASAAVSASGAPSGASTTAISVSPAFVGTSSGPTSPAGTYSHTHTGHRKIKAHSGSVKHGTFPRLNPPAARASSAAASPPVDSIMRGGGSPVRTGASPSGPPSVGRSPEPFASSSGGLLLGNTSMLYPRPTSSFGGRSGASSAGGNKVSARTPPQSQKKRTYSGNHRRNSEFGVESSGVDSLPARMEDMDLGDETPNSGYSSDASTLSVESHMSSFPYPSSSCFPAAGTATVMAGLGGVGDLSDQRYNPAVFEEEEELTSPPTSSPAVQGGIATPSSRFPSTPSSPMQLRAGGMAPTPHKMAGLPATPSSIAATPSSSTFLILPPGTPKPSSTHPYSSTPHQFHLGNLPIRPHSRLQMDYPSSAESSALQSPHFDSSSFHASNSSLPSAPSSTLAAARAPAPFSFPMSPITIDGVADVVANAQQQTQSGNSRTMIQQLHRAGAADSSTPTENVTSNHYRQGSQSTTQGPSPAPILQGASLTPLPQPTPLSSGLVSPAPPALKSIVPGGLPYPHAEPVSAGAVADGGKNHAVVSPRVVVPPLSDLSALVLATAAGGGNSSAFSSTRSGSLTLGHSASGTSIGQGSLSSARSSDFSSVGGAYYGGVKDSGNASDSGMDWAETPTTARSINEGGVSNSSSATSLHQLILQQQQQQTVSMAQQ